MASIIRRFLRSKSDQDAHEGTSSIAGPSYVDENQNELEPDEVAVEAIDFDYEKWSLEHEGTHKWELDLEGFDSSVVMTVVATISVQSLDKVPVTQVRASVDDFVERPTPSDRICTLPLAKRPGRDETEALLEAIQELVIMARQIGVRRLVVHCQEIKEEGLSTHAKEVLDDIGDLAIALTLFLSWTTVLCPRLNSMMEMEEIPMHPDDDTTEDANAFVEEENEEEEQWPPYAPGDVLSFYGMPSFNRELYQELVLDSDDDDEESSVSK